MRTFSFSIFLVAILLIAAFIGALAYFTYSPRQNPPQADAGRQALPDVAPPSPARPVITSSDPVRGNPAAPLAIVEFGDFFCPACAEVEATLTGVLAQYEGKVKLVWKDFPNTRRHLLAARASEAARCAGEQGRFWEYHDQLLERQAKLSEEEFHALARELGLSSSQFSDCLSSGRTVDLTTRSQNEGLLLGVDATPYFFVGSRRFSGIPSYQELQYAIDNLAQ